MKTPMHIGEVLKTQARIQPERIGARDLNRAMDWSLPDEEATTIAGLVIHEAQTIPDTGQVFTFHGHRFEVRRKSRNRITQLRITPLKPSRKLRADKTPKPD